VPHITHSPETETEGGTTNHKQSTTSTTSTQTLNRMRAGGRA